MKPGYIRYREMIASRRCIVQDVTVPETVFEGLLREMRGNFALIS